MADNSQRSGVVGQHPASDMGMEGPIHQERKIKGEQVGPEKWWLKTSWACDFFVGYLVQMSQQASQLDLYRLWGIKG